MNTRAFEAVESGGGGLSRIKGIYLLSLSGSYEAMGEQMYDLTSGIVGDRMMAYYRDLPEKLIAHSFAAEISKSLPPLVAGTLYFLFKRLGTGRSSNRLEGLLKGLLNVEPELVTGGVVAGYR